METVDFIRNKQMQILDTTTAKQRAKSYYCCYVDFKIFNEYHQEYVLTLGINGKEWSFIDSLTSLASVSRFDVQDPNVTSKIAKDAKVNPAKYVVKYYLNK